MNRPASLLALLFLFSLVSVNGQELLFRGIFVPGQTPIASGADARWAIQPGDSGLISVVPTGVESTQPVLRLKSESTDEDVRSIPAAIGLFQPPAESAVLRLRLTVAAMPKDEFSGMIVLRRELEPLFRLKINQRTGFIESDANDQQWIPLFQWTSGSPFTLEITADLERGEGRIRFGQGREQPLRLSRPNLVPDRLQISTGLMMRSRGTLELSEVVIETVPAKR